METTGVTNTARFVGRWARTPEPQGSETYKPMDSSRRPTRRPPDVLELREDGTAVDSTLGPDDRFVHREGTWRVLSDDEIEVSYDDGELVRRFARHAGGDEL